MARLGEPFPYIAYGGGTQSTALLILACRGEIQPRPSLAVFADTGDEPEWVYRTVAAGTAYAARYGIEVVTRSKGHALSREILDAADGKRTRFETTPAYTQSGGALMQKCTQEFKIRVIHREIRRRIGRRRNARAVGYIGISRDEASRAKPSRVPWIEFRWPLIDLGLQRHECIRIVEDALGFIPKRSACVHCPYHSGDYWTMLKAESPQGYALACRVDEAYRRMAGKAGVAENAYLSARRVPLERIRFDAQQTFDGFGNECGGFCGV